MTSAIHQVGDLVTIIGNSSGHMFKHNERVRITMVVNEITGSYCGVSPTGGGSWYFKQSECAPLGPPTNTAFKSLLESQY